MIVESKTFITKNNMILEVRSAKKSDASKYLKVYRTACSETRNLSRGLNDFKISIEQEKQYISFMRDDPMQVLLVAVVNGEIVGGADIAYKSKLYRDRHRCTLGIMLMQKYTGLGIGTILINRLAEIARYLGYEQIELTAVGKNTDAIRLYERLGFKQVGIIPNAQKYEDGTYDDEVYMVKTL